MSSDWIYCEDNLPEPYIPVLVSEAYGGISIMWLVPPFGGEKEYRWFNDSPYWDSVKVYAWKPLSEKAKALE